MVGRWKDAISAKEDVQNTGYVSSAISDENGLFTENPVITRTLEAKYKAYGIYIAFGNKLPKKFIIRTYADNVLNDTTDNSIWNRK